MPTLFDAFTQERLYLNNVTPATLNWYATSFAAFRPYLPEDVTQSRKQHVLAAVTAMRKRGLKVESINTYARCLNAFFNWAHQEGHFDERVRIPRLKTEDKIPPTYSEDAVERLLEAKPKLLNQRRAQALAILVLDTGLRLSEALGLRLVDVDLENCLVRVIGKGRKQRLVPLSMTGRRYLYTWTRWHKPRDLVFETRKGTKLTPRNAQRDFHLFCDRWGVQKPPRPIHALRHHFAVTYLRNGGDVFRLQRILGHSTLEMTRRYVSFETSDLQAVHDQLSPLAGRR